jgi:hypothetical protein
VWWKRIYYDKDKPKYFTFEWPASIQQRRDDGADCPYLTNHRILSGFNDLKTLNPKLAAEWHPTKNGTLTPDMVPEFYTKNVWWRAKIMGEWREWECSVTKRSCGVLGIPELKFESKLEILIAEILFNNNVFYKRQEKLPGCVSARNAQMSYDFGLIDGILIEGDGIQHFSPRKQFGHIERLEIQIDNDNRKTLYAFENNMQLLRIPYIYDDNPDKIKSFILEFLETKKVPQDILDFYAKFKFSNYVECVKAFEEKQERAA